VNAEIVPSVGSLRVGEKVFCGGLPWRVDTYCSAKYLTRLRQDGSIIRPESLALAVAEGQVTRAPLAPKQVEALLGLIDDINPSLPAATKVELTEGLLRSGEVFLAAWEARHQHEAKQ
jgi:hypothetical protein